MQNASRPIKTVKTSDDGWHILTEEHTGFFIDKRHMEYDAKADPKPGDRVDI